MRIELDQVGKRYRRDWILRKISYVFEPGGRYAITGPNGAGKSTLLRLLSGHLTPSRGQIRFGMAAQAIKIDEVYKSLAYAAPYIELIEEFTLLEAIHFHQKFKPFLDGLGPQQTIDILGLQRSSSLQIRDFSSGMKQRLKLALSILSDTPILLLDEPSTNLDEQGANWYLNLLQDYARQRLLVVASNVVADYQLCPERLSILDYK